MAIQEDEHNHLRKVHRMSVHSYSAYLIFILIGIVLDLIFRFRIFTNEGVLFLGPILIVSATCLIFWSQYTVRTMPREDITHESFFRGPYRYTRSPTQWGLFFLMLGFGIMLHATFVILFALIAFIFIRMTFLVHRERAMEEHYGDHYALYKKSFRF